MTSQISPDHFEAFVAPYVNMVFDHVRSLGAHSSLFVCGDATRNLHVMAETTCDNISIDENIPLESLRDLTRAEGKSFGGNLKLTAALLLGDEDDCKLDAIRCIDTGGSCGFILAPGCDLPYGVPPENLQAVSEMVHDEYKREVAKRTIVAKTATDATGVDLPDYDADERVHIDVITLDSASCAPCQYMMDAAHRAAKGLDLPVKIQEHRITTREGIGMMSRMGVANIPTICIDGEPKFVSIIPDQNTLVDAIRQRAEEKK
jgi:uroporphyrinogen decarboxylase